MYPRQIIKLPKLKKIPVAPQLYNIRKTSIMNKIMIAAAATAALATYLISRKRARKAIQIPVGTASTPGGTHLTNVFAKAKKYNM